MKTIVISRFCLENFNKTSEFGVLLTLSISNLIAKGPIFYEFVDNQIKSLFYWPIISKGALMQMPPTDSLGL